MIRNRYFLLGLSLMLVLLFAVQTDTFAKQANAVSVDKVTVKIQKFLVSMWNWKLLGPNFGDELLNVDKLPVEKAHPVDRITIPKTHPADRITIPKNHPVDRIPIPKSASVN